MDMICTSSNTQMQTGLQQKVGGLESDESMQPDMLRRYRLSNSSLVRSYPAIRPRIRQVLMLRAIRKVGLQDCKRFATWQQLSAAKRVLSACSTTGYLGPSHVVRSTPTMPRYSLRSAVTGLIAAACRAGMNAAIRPVAAKTMSAVASSTGSVS